MSAEFDFMSASDLLKKIACREVSPVEVTMRAICRAEAVQPTINAFSVLTPELALEQARAAEKSVMQGRNLGRLHGIPVSVKDLIAVKGLPFSLGSKSMKNNVADLDAPSVEKLRAAGAIIIGKTTTSEFGCKAVGDSPLTGITRHPWNLDCSPGGSSAGAAASVAAGVTALALGTDGGGSLRIPASLTGCVGFKQSFGRVPVWPVSATPTLAHVGPLTRNVHDAALMAEVISGFDERDPHSIAASIPTLISSCSTPLQGLRIAYSPTLGYAIPDSEVLKQTDRVFDSLKALGAKIEYVEEIFTEDPREIWMNAFYAGVSTRLRSTLESHEDILDPAVAIELSRAANLSMYDYFGSVFRRYNLRDNLRLFYEKYDILITPTLPVSAIPAGCNIPPGFEGRGLLDWVYYTYPFNLTGNPALSLCAGFANDNMPVGIQVVGRSLHEQHVINVACTIEGLFPKNYNIRKNT